MEVRGVPLAGGGFVTTYLDVTEQRRNQQLVAHMAQHDPLTDLPNRMLFHDRLKTALAQVKRGGMMAVHYLDLDNFKPVNDSFGHQAGDALLVSVATRIRKSVREHDTIARLGGDEFAVLQTSIRKPGDAAILAGRLLRAVADPFQVSGRDIQVGLSIGIAVAPEDGLTSDDLLIKADSALYHSKSHGRSCFNFFHAAAA
jgi:diguanylate cyclase (GGDEF)-like protein